VAEAEAVARGIPPFCVLIRSLLMCLWWCRQGKNDGTGQTWKALHSAPHRDGAAVFAVAPSSLASTRLMLPSLAV